MKRLFSALFLLFASIANAEEITKSQTNMATGETVFGGNATSVVFLDSSSKLATNSLYTFTASGGLSILSLTGSGSQNAASVGYNSLLSHTAALTTNEVHFNLYSNFIDTGTVDHTGDAAHAGSVVARSSNTFQGAMDLIPLEGRLDFRTLQSNVEGSANFGYCDWVSTGAVGSATFCAALRARGWNTTNGSSGSPNLSGILYGLYVEDLKGGATTSRAIYQEGTDDFAVFLASVTSIGEGTTMLNNKVQIVQPMGADLRPALALYSGLASSDLLMSFGSTAPNESDIARIGTAGNWFTGSAQGDLAMSVTSTSGNLAFTVGLNAQPELKISNNAIVMRAADNSTVLTSSIAATQANITGADTYISFNSNTGQEGSVAGTGVAGVLAYNTFTGAHFTKVMDADVKNIPMLTLLDGAGRVMRKIPGLSQKDQLVETHVCKTRASKKVLGFYAGTDGKKESALALGTGLAWVANKGQDVEDGDLLMSSDVEGAVELQVIMDSPETVHFPKDQKDDVVRNITVAKARQPIQWKPGEKKRKIAVVYTCG